MRIADELSVRIETEASAVDGRRQVSLLPSGDGDAALLRHGRLPLPPYLGREEVPADRERYQTVYANCEGSIAAPTAGLHFTSHLLSRLSERGIETTRLVLHVGPGTFKPVTAVDVRDHRVEAEPFEIPPSTASAIERVRARGGRVVAVGTTTTRALEAVAASHAGAVPACSGETDIVIVPGFSFRVVDALITNFHLPRSSLLLLVSALAGQDRILSAYRDAIESGYRFYSYGDAMLII